MANDKRALEIEIPEDVASQFVGVAAEGLKALALARAKIWDEKAEQLRGRIIVPRKQKLRDAARAEFKIRADEMRRFAAQLDALIAAEGGKDAG